jgi:hypothetical protein
MYGPPQIKIGNYFYHFHQVILDNINLFQFFLYILRHEKIIDKVIFLKHQNNEKCYNKLILSLFLSNC